MQKVEDDLQMIIPFERPLNIAVIFDQEVSSGGGFQQGLNAALLASKIDNKLAYISFFHTKKRIEKNLKNNGINSRLIDLNFFKKLYLYLKTTDKYRVIYKIIRIFFDYHFFESFLLKKNIDLVYFISPSRYALDLYKLNFIFTIWDLCHREYIEFPEVKLKGEFENRELRIKYASEKAISIIVDSEYSKLNLQKKYNVNKSRIKIIPFEPLIDIKNSKGINEVSTKILVKYKVKNKYIFYPAQLWPHKNHIYILQGIYILEKKHKVLIDAVFAGGDKGNKQKIINYANKLGIGGRVIFTGFLTNKELISFYKMSLALVMPTFFGPTNIPPLEAFKLGTPIIYSDLDGLRDQVKDAGLLVDLYDAETLSNCILNLIKNTKLRSELINKGYKVYRQIENYDRIYTLNEILKDFIVKYSNFKNN